MENSSEKKHVDRHLFGFLKLKKISEFFFLPFANCCVVRVWPCELFVRCTQLLSLLPDAVLAKFHHFLLDRDFWSNDRCPTHRLQQHLVVSLLKRWHRFYLSNGKWGWRWCWIEINHNSPDLLVNCNIDLGGIQTQDILSFLGRWNKHFFTKLQRFSWSHSLSHIIQISAK